MNHTTICTILLSLFLSHIAQAEEQNNKRERAPKRNPCIVHHVGVQTDQAEKTRLFILSGQSNMAGLDEKSTFLPAIVKAFPKDKIIIVKDSQSGQPICKWYKEWKPVGEFKTAGWRLGQNKLYVRLMESVNKSIADKNIDSVAFVWMQGEADAKKGQSTNYKESLLGLINNIKRDIKKPNMVAVVGRLSDHKVGDEHWDRLRSVQMELAKEHISIECVDTDSYNGPKDGLHYNGDGYKKLGQDFADSCIKLLK